ncbi:redoxin domain-containing protein [Neobacillus kokaensis]|uniref:Thiol:disulfide interchange protein tlpA n=1 Tax=Neobacillus kokaensis TaxID=2759023 RepID=A0ABQ3N6I5_9BACI|nr:redoxin domain-containing protein [Neobacillus kokaensis]GHH99108.1 thiol:disulfide interchange protein tlpA [Neobacillus kokaensis]
MIKKVIAAVVLIALLTVAIVQAVDKKSDKQPDTAKEVSATALTIGAKAPDFELKTLNGESVRLSDLKGKKLMLNFWATWCGPCKAEMPEMEEFYKSADKDIKILAVNIDPQLDVKGFVDEYKITFPVLLDTEDAVNTKYQVISIPTTYFIDSNGIIQNKFVGTMKLDDMKDFTNKLK